MPGSLRRRAAVELVVLASLSALYLWRLPQRPLALDVAMGGVGVTALGVLAWQTRGQVWPRAAPAEGRADGAGRLLALVTAAALLALAGVGAWDAYAARHDWRDVATRLVGGRALLGAAVYAPWALVQQVLFQVYLLGRWRLLLPGAPQGTLALANGAAFGAVHLPDASTALVTAVAGVFWSYVYARDRRLVPVALSHAALGWAFLAWVRGADLLAGLADR